MVRPYLSLGAEPFVVTGTWTSHCCGGSTVRAHRTAITRRLCGITAPRASVDDQRIVSHRTSSATAQRGTKTLRFGSPACQITPPFALCCATNARARSRISYRPCVEPWERMSSMPAAGHGAAASSSQRGNAFRGWAMVFGKWARVHSPVVRRRALVHGAEGGLHVLRDRRMALTQMPAKTLSCEHASARGGWACRRMAA